MQMIRRFGQITNYLEGNGGLNLVDEMPVRGANETEEHRRLTKTCGKHHGREMCQLLLLKQKVTMMIMMLK